MKKSNIKFFAERLKSIRERKNITVEEIASFTGLYKGYIENLERGYIRKLYLENWTNMLYSLEHTLLDYR